MREAYNEELKKVKEDVLLMSSQAEMMLTNAVDALIQQDAEKAKEVIRNDDNVDTKEIEVQQFVSEVIARQQPVATDLRRLSSTYKVINNLERIADLAVNICQRIENLSGEAYFKPLEHIREQADKVKEQLKMCIQAYVDEDISHMKAIVNYEEEIDQLETKVYNECVQAISKHPELSEQGVNLSFVSRDLERVGDHATNIFETVYYIVTAHFIDFNDLDEANV